MSTNIARGTLLFFIGEGLFVISGYIIHVFLGRKLGPSLYGSYSVVIAFVSAIATILSTGIPRAASKYISQNPQDYNALKKTTRKLSILLGIFLFLLIIICANPVSSLLGDSSLSSYILLSSFMVPLFGLYALETSGYLNGLRKYKEQVISHISYYFAKTVLVLGLVLIGFSLAGAIIGFSFAPLIGLTVAIILNKKNMGKERDFSYRKVLIFSFPVVIFSLSNNFFASIDLFMIKAVLEDSNLAGYYSASSNISKVLIYLPVALSSVVFPSISKSIFRKDSEKTKNYIYKSYILMLPMLIIASLLMFIFSSQIITLLYSSRYIAGSEPLKILSIGMVFFSLYSFSTYIITAAGKPYLVMCLSIGMLLVSFPLNYLFVSMLGISGAAISTTIISFFALLATSFYIYKYIYK